MKNRCCICTLFIFIYHMTYLLYPSIWLEIYLFFHLCPSFHLSSFHLQIFLTCSYLSTTPFSRLPTCPSPHLSLINHLSTPISVFTCFSFHLPSLPYPSLFLYIYLFLFSFLNFHPIFIHSLHFPCLHFSLFFYIHMSLFLIYLFLSVSMYIYLVFSSINLYLSFSLSLSTTPPTSPSRSPLHPSLSPPPNRPLLHSSCVMPLPSSTNPLSRPFIHLSTCLSTHIFCSLMCVIGASLLSNLSIEVPIYSAALCIRLFVLPVYSATQETIYPCIYLYAVSESIYLST